MRQVGGDGTVTSWREFCVMIYVQWLTAPGMIFTRLNYRQDLLKVSDVLDLGEFSGVDS